MRKFLIVLLCLILGIALVYKSPFSALFNYNKAKALYDKGLYEESLKPFESSLFASPKDKSARLYYVMALSKSNPTYSVQKKLYEISISHISDEASTEAQTGVNEMRNNLLKGFEGNYISNAIMGDDILRWDIKTFPLKVYISKQSDIPDYYYSAVKTAFERWEERSNFVKFEMCDTLDNANIIIKFKDIPQDVCQGNICNYTTAYTEPDIDKNNLLKKMNLTFYKTTPKKDNFSDLEIFNTALHEIGHTLGIMGHSSNPNDIMYAQKDQTETMSYARAYHSITMRDLKTLALLYRLKPTISNVKNLHSESFYYAPLIIGSTNSILEEKLKEYQNYIEKYPNMASGYINLASVYDDMRDFNSALKTLEQGETYAKTKDEQYLIYYNRAVIYFNTKQYDQALNSANKAKAIKNNPSVDELITEIKEIKP